MSDPSVGKHRVKIEFVLHLPMGAEAPTPTAEAAMAAALAMSGPPVYLSEIQVRCEEIDRLVVRDAPSVGRRQRARRAQRRKNRG